MANDETQFRLKHLRLVRLPLPIHRPVYNGEGIQNAGYIYIHPRICFPLRFFSHVFSFLFFSGAKKMVLLKYGDRKWAERAALCVFSKCLCTVLWSTKTLWIAWSVFALCCPCVKTQPEIGLPQPCYNFRPLSLLLVKIITSTENISGYDCCPLL